MLNDGVAIVLSQILIGVAIGGSVTAGDIVVDFIGVFMGRILIAASSVWSPCSSCRCSTVFRPPHCRSPSPTQLRARRRRPRILRCDGHGFGRSAGRQYDREPSRQQGSRDTRSALGSTLVHRERTAVPLHRAGPRLHPPARQSRRHRARHRCGGRGQTDRRGGHHLDPRAAPAGESDRGQDTPRC